MNNTEPVKTLPMVMAPLDVAAVLGLSKNTVYGLFHQRDFPAFRVGKQLRVSRDAFERWMASASEDRCGG